MRPEDWERAEELFHQLIALDTGQRRAALADLAADDRALASELESLLDGDATGALDLLLSRVSPRMPVASPDILTGLTIRQYEVGELIGRGGMGDVYRARDSRLSRDVAMKFLPPWLGRDPTAKERFLIEARIVSSLDHPNVCTLFELGETEEGRLFLLMPFYEGETLKHRMKRGPRSTAEAVEIARQVAGGLAATHERGIIHRDIKPANLLITTSGRVKILDFGVAKLANVNITRPGDQPGTVSYMSPEQASGVEIDARTDLWSLGVVLYEMLAGERPFSGERAAVVVEAVRRGEFPELAERAAGVPAGLRAIVHRLLALRPEDRYPDASAVSAALSAWEQVTPEAALVSHEAGETGDGWPATVRRFFSELKHRRMFRAALIYCAAGLAVIEAADLVFPSTPLPGWTVTLVVWLVLLGLPLALALAWVFDLTPDGVRRAAESDSAARGVAGAGGGVEARTMGPVGPAAVRAGAAPDLRLPHPIAPPVQMSLPTIGPVTSGADELEPRRTAPDRPSVDESRQVTVVASLLVPYVEIVEALEPNAAQDLIERMHGVLRDVAERHGGTVDRCAGEEGILAFGVPGAHEDDPRRAVRAAIEARAAVRSLDEEVELPLSIELGLRSGIDTGQVVVRAAAERESGFELVGRAGQRATRLAASAENGEVRVSPECRSLIEAYYSTDPREPLMTGGAPPLVPHVVVSESSIRSRFEAAALRGLTPLVARDAELAMLRNSFERIRGGSGCIVHVLGDAGVGKSRLLHDFKDSVDRASTEVAVGRCDGHGQPIHYLPFIQLLRGLLRVEDSADGGAAPSFRERVLGIDARLEEFLPLYRHLLALDAEGGEELPPHLKGEDLDLALQDAVVALLTQASRQRPLVLVLEDWHWVDPSSDALMQRLADLVADYPILVVVTSRPGGALYWTDHREHTRLVLKPFGPAASATMLRSMLGVERVDEDLAELLHARSGGNPFFLEEICRSLLEAGAVRVKDGVGVLPDRADATRLPNSVQAILRTRIDRLDPAARDVLRLASVVGEEFDAGLLREAGPEIGDLSRHLATLRTADLIRQVRIVPAPAYRFKHVLVRDVTYDSIVRHERRRLHARVGEAVERRPGPDTPEYWRRLAHHFREAEAWDRAIDYGIRAAERLMDLDESAEALAMLDSVEETLAPLPETAERRVRRIDVMFHQERLSEVLGRRERQQAVIDGLIELLDPETEPGEFADAYLRQGDFFTLLGRQDEAEQYLQAALEMRRKLSDAPGVRKVLRSLGLLRVNQGRVDEALRLNEEALEIDRARGEQSALVGDLINRGNLLRRDGRPERARAVLEEALELSVSISGPLDTSDRKRLGGERWLDLGHYLLHALASVLDDLGDTEAAITHLREAREQSAANGQFHDVGYHSHTLASVLLRHGRIEQALAAFQESVDAWRRALWAGPLARVRQAQGATLLELGRGEEAIEPLTEAAELFHRLGENATAAHTWADLATIHDKSAASGLAESAWERARALFEGCGQRAGERRALEGLARTARDAGAAPTVTAQRYTAALAIADDLGQRSDAGRIRNILGILAWERGEPAVALDYFRSGLADFRAAGDKEAAGQMENSLGACLKALGRTDEARAHLEAAIAGHHKAGRFALAGYALATLADLELEEGDGAAARRYYEASLDIRRSIGDRAGEGWMLYGLSRAHASGGASNAAREAADRAAEIAAELADAELADACDRLRRAERF